MVSPINQENPEFKDVLLPFGKIIKQHKKGQSISNDVAALNEYILQNFNEREKKILDLGCGNGIIAIMLANYRTNWKITGIDIQEELISLAKINSTNENISFKVADLKVFSSKEKFDIIVSNPPFFRKDSGRLSPNKIRQIARHEVLCEMKDVLDAIKRNLKKSGNAFLIYPQEREKELKTIVKKIDLQIVKTLLVNYKNKERKIYNIKYVTD